jgi:hypothetical protein
MPGPDHAKVPPVGAPVAVNVVWPVNVSQITRPVPVTVGKGLITTDVVAVLEQPFAPVTVTV